MAWDKGWPEFLSDI